MSRTPRPGLDAEIAAGYPARSIAGIDEVGRGPLAGPVVAAAVVLPADGLPADLAAQIDDSKRLTAARRSRVADRLTGHCLWALGRAEAGEIDAFGLSAALALAMRRALAGLPRAPDLALIDGRWVPPDLGCEARAIVKGDRSSLSIAAASILAKVARDREMARLDGLMPGYGWARNAGYPTAEHRAALARLGPSPQHRRSFRPVADVVNLLHEKDGITI